MAVDLKSSTPRSAAVLKELVARNNGWLSFEKFMAAALYDPELGYYATQIRDVGRTGDFSTSAQGNSLLAKALALWARSQKKRFQFGFHWHLIEVGGGNGNMAATLLRNLGVFGRLGLTYHLVEVSLPLRQRQMKKLTGYHVRWHDSLSEAIRAARGAALIFSNEVVDAYPCRRLRRSGNEWSEIGTTLECGQIEESFRAISEVENSHSSIATLAENSAVQIVEVHAAYREELLRTVPLLTRGAWLTIDYGNTFPALYYRQPNGTARGYFHHQRVEGMEIYTRIGRQDLTADVNFTDLQNWGVDAGLTNESLETQREFIVRQLGQFTPRTTDEARLLDPVGAGSAFKVLQQAVSSFRST